MVLQSILFTDSRKMSIELRIRYFPTIGGEGGKTVKKEEILTLRVSNPIRYTINVWGGAVSNVYRVFKFAD